MGQTATVKLSVGETVSTSLGRGVRQDCLLSLLLFNIYAEAMIARLLKWIMVCK